MVRHEFDNQDKSKILAIWNFCTMRTFIDEIEKKFQSCFLVQLIVISRDTDGRR